MIRCSAVPDIDYEESTHERTPWSDFSTTGAWWPSCGALLFFLNKWIFFARAEWRLNEAEHLILWMPEGMRSRDIRGGGGKGSQKQFLCPAFKGQRLEQSHIHPGWPLEARITYYTGMSCHSIFIFKAGLAQRMQMCLLRLLRWCKGFRVNESESLGVQRGISRDIFRHTGFLQGSTQCLKTFKLCWQHKRNSRLISCAAT